MKVSMILRKMKIRHELTKKYRQSGYEKLLKK